MNLTHVNTNFFTENDPWNFSGAGGFFRVREKAPVNLLSDWKLWYRVMHTMLPAYQRNIFMLENVDIGRIPK